MAKVVPVRVRPSAVFNVLNILLTVFTVPLFRRQYAVVYLGTERVTCLIFFVEKVQRVHR